MQLMLQGPSFAKTGKRGFLRRGDGLPTGVRRLHSLWKSGNILQISRDPLLELTSPSDQLPERIKHIGIPPQNAERLTKTAMKASGTK